MHENHSPNMMRRILRIAALRFFVIARNRRRILEALQDQDYVIRIEALQALATLPDNDALDPVIAMLSDGDDRVRLVAVESMGAMPPGPQATAPLAPLLKDKSPQVRTATADALDKLLWAVPDGPLAAWYLVAKADWDRCAHLGAMAILPLIEALNDPIDRNRAEAAKALGEIGDSSAVDSLIACIYDRDLQVSNAAIDALGQIGDRRALEKLIARIELFSQPHYGYRRPPGGPGHLAKALGLIGDPSAKAPLLACMRYPYIYENDLQTIVDALVGIGGGSEAVSGLIDILRSSSITKASRWAAAGALKCLFLSDSLGEHEKKRILNISGYVVEPRIDVNDPGADFDAHCASDPGRYDDRAPSYYDVPERRFEL